MRRGPKRPEPSTRDRDDIDDPRLRLVRAAHERDRRRGRLQRSGRLAAVGCCAVFALGGLTAGASALLSVTTDLPFILEPPNAREPAAGPISGRTNALRARLLRVPVHQLGPSLAVPLADIHGAGDAIPYATKRDLCVVIAPPLSESDRYLPSRGTQWQCLSQPTVIGRLRRGGGQVMYFVESTPPVLVGFTRRDITQITVRGAEGTIPAMVSRPWRAGVRGMPVIRLWAAYPLSLIDRLRPETRTTKLSRLRITATTRRGITKRVPFP